MDSDCMKFKLNLDVGTFDAPTRKSNYNAQKRRYIAQYTSIPTLERILKNKQLKLNRIDKVNDLYEYQHISLFPSILIKLDKLR